MTWHSNAQLEPLLKEKTFTLAKPALLDLTAEKLLRLVKNVKLVAIARQAHLTVINVLLAPTVRLDKASAPSALPDRTAMRERRSPHFAHLALTVRKAQLLVTCVVREASALEAHQPLRNALPAPTAALVRASAPTALPALTAVLEKASVHSALLALTAVMVRKNVQNALKDPSALRDRQFQQNVNLDPMLQLAQQPVPSVMWVVTALKARYKNVLMAHSVMLGSRNVHHAPLALSARVDLKPRVLRALTVLMDRRYVQLALKDHSALREPQFQQSVNLDPMLE